VSETDHMNIPFEKWRQIQTESPTWRQLERGTEEMSQLSSLPSFSGFDEDGDLHTESLFDEMVMDGAEY